MKRIHIINIIISIIGLSLVLEISGCRESNYIVNCLDTADSLMEERPDSSLHILNKIDDSDLKRERMKARYALLKSMALDKNYIDTTTFDVLQPAIDYYIRHGNSDEKLKTFYYKGRIHKNSGQYDLAMQTYLNGLDLEDEITDSLTLARLLVAQGTLLYRQYKIKEFVSNNLHAGDIYGLIGKKSLMLRSYYKALNGAIIIDDKSKADSIMHLCSAAIKNSPSLRTMSLIPFLRYVTAFGDIDEIKAMIKDVEESGIVDDVNINLARAYSKIGEPEKGLMYLNNSKVSLDDILDTLSYWSIKTEILTDLGYDNMALDSYKNYSRLLEEYHMRLFSNELLFSEKKHEMEIESMGKIHKREKAIKWILVGVAVLICIIGFIYYRYRLNKAGRRIAEQNAEKLQLEADKLLLERENLQLETEKLQLQTKNMHLEISQLESEQERLTALLEQRDELSYEMRDIIRERLDLLNGLLAKEISNDESYAKPFRKYVEILHKDRKKFQDSTRKAFQAMYPNFIADLIKKGLTEREINYVCLYSLGLRGKEIGSYLDLARHYNISSEIRRKLGLGANGSNLGPYIRMMMNQEK